MTPAHVAAENCLPHAARRDRLFLVRQAAATVATGTYPYSVTVDPTGQYAYVANYNSANVSQYTIGSTGALTAMSTATVATGNSPRTMTVDPTGQYAYVAYLGSNTVSQYTIGATGALTAMSTATVTTGSAPQGIVTAP